MKTGRYVHTQVHDITEVRISREGDRASWLVVELISNKEVVADFTVFTPHLMPSMSIPHLEIGPNIPHKVLHEKLD